MSEKKRIMSFNSLSGIPIEGERATDFLVLFFQLPFRDSTPPARGSGARSALSTPFPGFLGLIGWWLSDNVALSTPFPGFFWRNWC